MYIDCALSRDQLTRRPEHVVIEPVHAELSICSSHNPKCTDAPQSVIELLFGAVTLQVCACCSLYSLLCVSNYGVLLFAVVLSAGPCSEVTVVAAAYCVNHRMRASFIRGAETTCMREKDWRCRVRVTATSVGLMLPAFHASSSADSFVHDVVTGANSYHSIFITACVPRSQLAALLAVLSGMSAYSAKTTSELPPLPPDATKLVCAISLAVRSPSCSRCCAVCRCTRECMSHPSSS